MGTIHRTQFGIVELPDGDYFELDMRVDRRPARPPRGTSRRVPARHVAVGA